MPATAGQPGWGVLARSPAFKRLAVLSFGVWLHAADELMVSTITPAMVGEIGGLPYVAWLIALYEVGSIVAGAVAAFAVLRMGLREALALSGLIYAAGCLISGLAPDMAQMLAGRLCQGIGGGAMIAIAFIGVHRIIEPRLTARAYALISLVWGVSAFTGPLVGAGFADGGWWRGAFHLFAIQALAFAVASYLLLARHGEGAPEKQATGSAMAILARVAILSAGIVAIAASGNAANATASVSLLITGVLLLSTFLWLDARAGAARLLPARVHDLRLAQGAAVAVVVLYAMATVSLITFGPILMSNLHGLDALPIGLILLLESAGWSVVAIVIAGLPMRREGAAILTGFLAVTIGVVMLVYAVPSGPVGLIAISALLQGGGMGAAWAFLVRRMTVLTAPAERDRAVSAIPTVQRFGYALGAAIAGIIANASGLDAKLGADALARTGTWIFAVSAIPAVIGLAAVLKFLRFGGGDTAGIPVAPPAKT
jgi:MFS family permease